MRVYIHIYTHINTCESVYACMCLDQDVALWLRMFAHGLMGHWIHSSQCFTSGATKVMVCASLSVERYIKIEPLLLIKKSSPCSGGSGFPLLLSEWSFTICLTLYNYK